GLLLPRVVSAAFKKWSIRPTACRSGGRWDRRRRSRTVAAGRTRSIREEGEMRRWWSGLRSESGQGMSEYLIIVALVAIAAIGVVTVFGRDVRELFSGTTDSLAGRQARNTGVRG